MAHETGHALGAAHEIQRSDRDQNIQMLWGNIDGCLPTATDSTGCGQAVCETGPTTGVCVPGNPKLTCTAAQQQAINKGCCVYGDFLGGADTSPCYQAGNFVMLAPQATLGPYDFDSVMHYGAGEFAKTGSSGTFTTTAPVPPGVVVGQTTHLSDGDVAGMRALYPVASIRSVLFRNTGVQTLAQLSGREQDIDLSATCVGGTLTTGATVNTALLNEGTTSFQCTLKSPMWAVGYNYPNSTNTTWPSSGLETFSSVVSTHVLNAGLIAIFTAPS